MGVDLMTYRCRIGSFVTWQSAGDGRNAGYEQGAGVGENADGGQGAGGMKFFVSFSKLIKLIGSLTFIGMLLLMAGIESNPGPTETFIFRYQYLLIDVGTKVLRRLFDVQVGHNFTNYLATHTPESGRLQHLINIHKITAEQENYLPPKDKNPTSSNFDVTLLAFLLRNICGLRPPGDKVWMQPETTDLFVEADIARLRICRNLLMHRDTVLIPDQAFDDKWKELCQILTRLNKICWIADLQSLIDDAENIATDKQLQECYNETLKAWKEREDAIAKVEDKVTVVEQGLAEVRLEVASVRKEEMKLNNHEKGILKDLIEFYKRRCKTLPVSPLFENKDENILKIYQRPTMNSVEGTKQIKQITCYEDKFCKGNKSCNQIYMTGDAGMGKTSFCTFMCLLWSVGKSEEKLDNEQKELQTDVDYMSKFDFVFYISLRDTEHYHVTDMIKEQYLQHYDPIIIQDLLRTKHCLILMDGLDEWTPRKDGKKENKIPERIYSEYCVYLTTSRPHRIESERLSNRDIDHKIELTGIHGNSAMSYVKHVISYMNKENSGNRKANDFTRELRKCGLDDQLCIPMIASHLVVLWFEKTLTDMPRALIYANILEMLFRRAKTRKVEFPPSTACTLQLPDSLSRVKKRKVEFPPSTACTLLLPDSLSRVKKRKVEFPPSTACTLQLPDSLSRVKTRKVEFPPSTACTLQLPDSLSGLEYMNKYVSLLYNVCHLSFRSLFKQDENVPSLVFTRQQLQAHPYCFSNEETDFLCKIGILSKNEVFGCYSVEKLKISFIHKSYIEFFASLFTSSFDTNNVYSDVTKRWTTLNDVLQFENFFLLLAGLSCNKVKFSIENIYLRVSDNITEYRRKSIFHYKPRDLDYYSYSGKINSLQNFVTSCYKEVSRCYDTNVVLKLENFVFDDDSNVDILKQLLLLNTTCVKSIYSVKGKYYDEFDQIKNLQWLHVGDVLSGDNVKFTECMLQNQSTLHTVCIKGSDSKLLQSIMQGGNRSHKLITELPVRSLQHLTSLSLSKVIMQHNSLHNLVKFLSDKVLIENIKLSSVHCDNHHWYGPSACTLTLNLAHHTKLTSLCLEEVNILCNNVNNSSLESITLYPSSERSVSCYSDVFNCIKYSQLEHLDIRVSSMRYLLDYNTMKTLALAVNTLPYIKSLTLHRMKLPDDVLLQLHPDVTQVKIELVGVSMSRQWFHCFIKSCVNNKSVIIVVLLYCNITSVVGDTHRVPSREEEKESLDYMSKNLTSIPTVNITYKNDYTLHFKTISCQ